MHGLKQKRYASSMTIMPQSLIIFAPAVIPLTYTIAFGPMTWSGRTIRGDGVPLFDASMVKKFKSLTIETDLSKQCGQSQGSI